MNTEEKEVLIDLLEKVLVKRIAAEAAFDAWQSAQSEAAEIAQDIETLVSSLGVPEKTVIKLGDRFYSRVRRGGLIPVNVVELVG